jgi:succinate dehydrogenase / fumarate reductase cytochrome b subunit
MFQSLGLSHPRYTPLVNKAAVAIAEVLVLGFISVPISVLTGVVQ